MGERSEDVLRACLWRRILDGTHRLWSSIVLIVFLVLSVFTPCPAIVSANLLRNPSFEQGMDENGLPSCWSLYGGAGTNRHIKLVELNENARTVISIDDGDANAEIGLMQTCPAKPGLIYEASVETRAFATAPRHGAYLQLRFLPSQKYVQTGLAGDSTKTFEKVSVKAIAPPDTKSARVYLYTHRSPTPKLLLRNAMLVSGVDPPPPPPPTPLPPVDSKINNITPLWPLHN